LGWEGDLSQMGQLVERLRDLTGVPSRAAGPVADRIDGLLQEEFDAGRDPYGTAWQGLSEVTLDRGRTPPPLTDTRGMRDSAAVRPLSRAGVGVTIAHPAAPHQTGWSGPVGSGPARPILPARSELPATWSDAIADEVRKEFRK
jgi:hypothetical protein